MEYIKKLIGLVTGVFCTLVVAWLCADCLKIDFKWYNALVKPVIVPGGGYFTLFVSAAYALNILVVARLVTGKHFFPSTLILAGIGLFSILFIYAFFARCNVYLGLVFMLLVFILSFIQQVRFFIKETLIALYYLPVFIFNCYCLVAVAAIAIAN